MPNYGVVLPSGLRGIPDGSREGSGGGETKPEWKFICQQCNGAFGGGGVKITDWGGGNRKRRGTDGR